MKKTIAALGFLAMAVTAGTAAADDHWTTDGGPYLSARVLAANARGATTGVYQYDYDPGFGAIAALGYAAVFPNHGVDLRVEIEASHRRTPMNEYWDYATDIVYPVSGDVVTTMAMGNVYIDVHTQTAWTPYVGVGFGRGQLKYNDYVFNGVPQGDSEWYVSAWQAMAGTGYRLSPGLSLELEYRYFQPNDPGFNGYVQNEVAVGLRMTF